MVVRQEKQRGQDQRSKHNHQFERKTIDLSQAAGSMPARMWSAAQSKAPFERIVCATQPGR